MTWSSVFASLAMIVLPIGAGVLAGLAAVVPLGLAWGYGAWRLGQPVGEPGPVAALVPGWNLQCPKPFREQLGVHISLTVSVPKTP